MAGINRTLSDNSSDDDEDDVEYVADDAADATGGYLTSADEQHPYQSQTSDDDEPAENEPASHDDTPDVEQRPSFMKHGFYSTSHSDDNDEATDTELQPPPAKMPRPDNNTSISMRMSKAYNMFMKWGYTEGKGLGKEEQGRVAPIELSTQKGRRGLGSNVDANLTAAGEQWVSDLEVIELHETVKWLVNDTDDLGDITRDVLDSWIVVGKVKKTIDDETKFVDPEILEKILRSKTVFDKLDAQEMRQARTKPNPFETISRPIFLNRVAV